MRVITGKYRGRRLKGPRGFQLRPTGDRLKEALFSILEPRIAGAVLFDIFSGTGSIGIEALSRGAAEVVFVEKDPGAVALIGHNLRLCGVDSGCTVIEDDAFRALRALARRGLRADILFFDPPYDWRPYRDLLGLAFDPALASPETAVVIEHRRNAVVEESGVACTRYRLLRQGDACLSFFRRLP